MEQNSGLKVFVDRAVAGDREALNFVVESIRDYVYNLALRMLLLPADAEDATQEILIKIITHLSTYEGRSAFKTWVYRIATNDLINYKSKGKKFQMPFDEYAQFIDTGHSAVSTYATNDGELKLLEEEVKISCTRGLLMCLRPEERAIYIVGDILEWNSQEAAEIFDISAVHFRKKLSRCRQMIRNFLQKKCGLVNPKNPCRCHRKIDFLAKQDLIKKKDLKFARVQQRSLDLLGQINSLYSELAIYQSVVPYNSPVGLQKRIKSFIAEI